MNFPSTFHPTNRTFIRHDYHDHGTVTMRDYLMAKLRKIDLNNVGCCDANVKRSTSSRGGVGIPFPTKLHLIVSIAENEGFDDIISWQPHGRCFQVHKPQLFVDKVLSTYFGQTKLASFQRQMNMYGFLRLTKGLDKGCYYHELFLRHKLYLCQDIVRIGNKGTGVKIKIDHSTEPDFYSMPFIEPDPALSPELIEWSRKYEEQHGKKESSNDSGLSTVKNATLASDVNNDMNSLAYKPEATKQVGDDIPHKRSYLEKVTELTPRCIPPKQSFQQVVTRSDVLQRHSSTSDSKVNIRQFHEVRADWNALDKDFTVDLGALF